VPEDQESHHVDGKQLVRVSLLFQPVKCQIARANLLIDNALRFKRKSEGVGEVTLFQEIKCEHVHQDSPPSPGL
jgi:hypothetical protein